MHDLIPLTALGKSTAQINSRGTVICEERPDVALVSVAARLGSESAARSALAALLGTDAPDVGHASGGNGFFAMWTGPDQWMIEAPYKDHTDLAAHVKAQLGDCASVTEQTDAWVRFDLSGADVHAVLERLTNLDTSALAVGATSRTSIHHLTSIVTHRTENGFALLTPRSSAQSFHHAIMQAMQAALD